MRQPLFSRLWRHSLPQFTPVDMAYRRTTTRLGVVLVVFLILFDTLGLLFAPINELAALLLPRDAAIAVIDVCDSLEYLLSFILPGILFYVITPRRERVPMQLSPVMPRGTVWLVLIGMMFISMAAIVNAMMVSVIGYGRFSSNVLWESSTMQDYEGVLLFISTAIVPAFCEEFLFRGVICNNLRPYGKTIAVVGSALLFGLMHQNVGQLFYTTVAGIVLGLVYVETRSIWAPILLHMFNNLTSVIYDIVVDRLDVTSSNRILALMDSVTIGLGLVALLVMIIRGERAKAGKSDSISLFGEWREEATQGEVTPAWRVRGFLSPTILVFIALSIWQTLWLLSIALRYLYG